MAKRCYSRAMITGGSSGIGFSIASLLVQSGCSAVLVGRSQDRLEAARNQLIEAFGDSVKITLLSTDISDRNQVREILGAEGEKEPFDLLVNSAGMVLPGAFRNYSDEQFDLTLSVNLTGTWNVLKTMIPYIKEGGTIVNVSSLAGLLGVYGYTAYGASKFALVGLSEVLRNELSAVNIQVSVLCPPDTDTPQLREEETCRPEETRALSGNSRILHPDEVADALFHGLNRNKFIIIPGMQAKMIYLIKRLMPKLIFFFIDRTVAGITKKRVI